MREILGLLWSVSRLGCDAATGTATTCGCKACGSLFSPSNKSSNEGNDSGKKAGGLANPPGLGSIGGGGGDRPEPPPEPLPLPPGPSWPGCLKALSLLLIFSSSTSPNSFLASFSPIWLAFTWLSIFPTTRFWISIFFASLNVTFNGVED